MSRWQIEADEIDRKAREKVCKEFKANFSLRNNKPHLDFSLNPLWADPNPNKPWDGSTLEPNKVQPYFLAAAQAIRGDLAQDPAPSETSRGFRYKWAKTYAKELNFKLIYLSPSN